MPTGLNVYHRIDVIVDPAMPPTVRTPDVVVVRAGAPEPTVPEDVALLAEILSPTTRQLDLVTKRAEYARAGIVNYWSIDVGEQTAEVLSLVDGRYNGSTRTGRIRTEVPSRWTSTSPLSPTDPGRAFG